MFNFLMTNSDVFDKLYQEINRQNTFYFWIIGIVVTIALGITVFFGVLEWRLSTKQIQNLKSEIIHEVDNTYKAKIQKLEKTLDEYKEYQTRKALVVANSLANKFFELETSDNPVKQSMASNDIVQTVNDIIKNDMVDDFVKVVTMQIFDTNAKDAQKSQQKDQINEIYKTVMNDKDAKKYYQASKHLFKELGKDESLNNK